MKFFFKIHDLYIGCIVLLLVLLIWLVLVGLDVVISGLLVEMSDIGIGNYDFLVAVINVVYSFSRWFYMLFSILVVIGLLVGFG